MWAMNNVRYSYRRTNQGLAPLLDPFFNFMHIDYNYLTYYQTNYMQNAPWSEWVRSLLKRKATKNKLLASVWSLLHA